ncbi:MAG: glycosyltransferase family 2 protein [Syntrophorhabdaceae bacterium]|nr:glycosyltransferase family 2 protein [Syntrophorhabdaceae bacterium]MDD5244420.1 glycosyltransferase family 2 protein [Syntrophorhabdaceae bacterium]
MNNDNPKTSSFKIFFITAIPILAIIFATIYLIVRILLFLITDYAWYEKVLALFLLIAELFILTHGIGYFFEIFSVIWRRKSFTVREDQIPKLSSYPPVAIVMPSYKEPLDVVENSLVTFYNISYPNKYIYFLDDTRYDIKWDTPEKMEAYKKAVEDLCRHIGVDLFRRKWHGAKAGIINDFLEFLDGKEKDGFRFYHYSGKTKQEIEKYMLVFDADSNPFPDFIEPLVAIMENNTKLAFVQTPQYYINFEFNRIARAAGLQQAVFYEYICEGKSSKDSTFCCGTNVLFRREALNDVGGFDETSVTEDFATSLQFHLKKWSTTYINRVRTFQIGPEDLGGYFKQQFRWSLGTIGLFTKVLSTFLRRPRGLTKLQWWEYFLSSTWYFIGFVFLFMMICPVIYIFLNIPTYFARPEFYFLIFIPYVVITLTTFYWTLKQRNYHIRDLLTGQLLTFITFPVYIKASILALAGIKGTFGITPKGVSKALPLRALWPQLVMAMLCFAAVVWGINRFIYEQEPAGGILVNTFWCLYHAGILFSVLYFNKPEESNNG